MKTTLFQKAFFTLALFLGLSVQSMAQVSYNVNPIAATNNSFTLNTKVTITGIDVTNYYGPGNFQYNIKLSYTNTITGGGNSGTFYSYQIYFYNNSSSYFQSAQSTSSIPVATGTGTMTSYGPNPGTTTLVTGTGLYTSPNVINAILTTVGLTVDAPNITRQTASATPATSTPLPVMIESFKASRDKGMVYLKWNTVSEHNNKGFHIESSNNGRDWNTIGFVASLGKEGNSSERLSYTFADAAVSGKTYYRLKQVDYNTDFAYSDVVSVSATQAELIPVRVYPNPASGSYVYAEGLQDKSTIRVYNAIGQQQAVRINNLANRAEISIADLSNGVYYINIDQNQYKIVVNH